MTHTTDPAFTRPTAGWQLEDDSATAYERELVPVFMAPWAADLVDTVGVDPGDHLADVACGTGIVARLAARRAGTSGEVTGIDINPAMLAVARQQSAGLVPPIRWEQAPADELPLPDGGCDVVLCQQGLQYFGDRVAAAAELRRVTKPGGRLGLSVCRGIDHQPAYAILADILDSHIGAAAGEVVRSPFGLDDAEHVRGLLTDAGFADARVRIAVWTPRFPSAEALLYGETASSPLGELVTRLEPEAQRALLDELTGRLRPHTDDQGVVFPFEILVVTATG